ncbi:MAG: ABC transporter [Deltaproteobacteria bacterium CG23_combo_of_CG06-09_8_20_14_all_51_20]|nr:ABC transporter ATP-binding protein [bacterium]OIP42772.1 MAG: ABC transporter [Desulfobacteraceae bacterium CG2_30_51_40]PIP46650.1 MAG: ABC transporter [Deltaproteobacteria bacterium CG23_combo_of_CG06-09_8_20_14_all_51_20]PIY24806.1 MAG: ABC transporter [Deltaproteobacteria bacterium CG_4_10_14_3_um_filter_51_14]
MSLRLESIGKKVGRETHIDAVSLEFEAGSRNVLLGRTLSGKTSLLRLMAGLDRPTCGRVMVNGQDVTGKSVRKRSIAMVYQQFINYPSLSVFDNIASPLKIAKIPKLEIYKRVRTTAEMLHLEGFLDRIPSELSGGQQQRVAIARALVKETDLLLLDEPLVNLDYKLREELRAELQDIFEARQAIVVYTTTEPTEALMLGGNVVVIDEGRVLQTGATPEVYHHPATTKVAEVFSDPPINFLTGRVYGGVARVGRNIEVPLHNHMKSLTEGNYTFGVRSNHLFVSRGSQQDIEIPATVELAEINGSETFIHANHGDIQLVVQEKGVRSVRIGVELTIYVSPSCFFVYDEEGALVASPSREATEAASDRRRHGPHRAE